MRSDAPIEPFDDPAGAIEVDNGNEEGDDDGGTNQEMSLLSPQESIGAPVRNDIDGGGDYNESNTGITALLDPVQLEIASKIDPARLVNQWIEVEGLGLGRVVSFRKRSAMSPLADSTHVVQFERREPSTETLVLRRRKLMSWNKGRRFRLAAAPAPAPPDPSLTASAPPPPSPTQQHHRN